MKLKNPEFWSRCGKILVKKTPSVVILGLGLKFFKKYFFFLFFFQNPWILVRGKILVKKIYTLGCEKKSKKKFNFFFKILLIFFFKNPEFWSRRCKILVKKNYTLGCEKKSKTLNFGPVAVKFWWKKRGCFLPHIRPSFLVRTSSRPYTAQIFIFELSVPILPHIQLI